MVWLRRLAWLLLPVLVLVLILAQGREDYRPYQGLEAPEPGTLSLEAQVKETLELEVQRSDGSAAIHAIVMSTTPHLAVGRADDAGRVQLSLPAPALPSQLMVYAPGHHVQTVHQDLAVASAPIQLRALSRLQGTPEVKPGLPRRLLIRDQDGRPLTGALLSARESKEANAEPWLAFVDAEGFATFPDVGSGSIQVEVFAPMLPPHQRNRLAQLEMGADVEEATHVLDVAYLEVTADAGTMLRWEHAADRDLLPMARVPESGLLRLGPVPLGDYRMQVGTQEYRLDLKAGENQLMLPPAGS